MEIKNKQKKYFLSDDKLNQYYKKLDSSIKIKSLYLKPDLCLNDLSIETGIAIEDVKKVLHQKFNLNFFDFISKYKLDKAKRLLIKKNDNEFSISNIAIESGFFTEDSFVVLFKKHTNTTPENYRIKNYKK